MYVMDSPIFSTTTSAVNRSNVCYERIEMISLSTSAMKFFLLTKW